MRHVQRVEQPEQLVGCQLWRTPAERQRIEPDRPLGVSRVEQHHVGETLGRDAPQHVGDQVALRLNHHHRPARRHVLRNEVQ
jgi:hypothetical protein